MINKQNMTDDPIKKLRIFAALPNSPWYENNLLTALAKFGEVINYTWDTDYNRMAYVPNPFGDGNASQRIVKFIKHKLWKIYKNQKSPPA